MDLQQCTSEEIEQYLLEQTGLIVPVGTCEQHGKHLPLNTDTMVAEHFAAVLAAETGFMVAPTINYGVNLPCDRVHAGTTGVRTATLEETLRSLVSWWKHQGFGPFLVLSAHGDPLHMAALKRAAPERAHVFELCDIPVEDLLEKQTGFRHACEAETSVMLYLFPEAVRRDRAVDFDVPFETFKPYLHHEKTEPLEGDVPGCLGFPSLASRAKGRAIYHRMRGALLCWAKERV